jgi:hypothetical protein
MKIPRNLLYFLKKSLKEKRDIYLVVNKEYKQRHEMGGCMQRKIIYDTEYKSSTLYTNTGCKFEPAILNSNWFKDKYIEMEVPHEVWE